jgi:hypothetical protein
MTAPTRISRRAIMAGSACAAPGAALARVPITTSHLDAELVDLGRQYAAAAAEMAAHTEHLNRLYDLFDRDAARPPEALRPRVGDHRIGLHPRMAQGGQTPGFYSPAQVNKLRGRQFTEQPKRPAQPEASVPWAVRCMFEPVPCPEKQSRANEIVAAYDEWERANNELRGVLGITSACDAFDDLYQRITDLHDKIWAMRVLTHEGLGVKAAILLRGYRAECRDSRRTSATKQFSYMAMRLAEDIAALTSLPNFAPMV